MILPEHEANRLLEAAGVPVISLKVAGSSKEAEKGAEDLGYPVVLKLSSSKYSHKTEIGGVCLNLGTGSEVEEAFGRLEKLRERLDPEATIIVEPMAKAGAEFFIGFQRHAQFGPVISLGFGGVSLELYQDVAFRLLPARKADFKEMLSELKCWPKLQKGFRNLPPVDESRVLHMLEQVAGFVASRPDVSELDLNPVIFRPDGALVADATIVAD